MKIMCVDVVMKIFELPTKNENKIRTKNNENYNENSIKSFPLTEGREKIIILIFLVPHF